MKRLSTFVVMLSLIFVACDLPLNPNARIDASKTTIEAGEILYLNAAYGGKYDHVNWIMPDGSTPTGTSTTFSSSAPGQYTIKLVSWSKRERHKSEDQIVVTVLNSTPGSIVVWTTNQSVVGMDVYLDYELIGTIVSYDPNQNSTGANISCGGQLLVSADAFPGQHNLQIKSNGIVYSTGAITITSNQCTKMRIY